METRIDLKFDDELINRKLDLILAFLKDIRRKEVKLMKEFDDLVTQVNATQGVVESVEVLIDGVIVKINDILAQLANTTDPVQVAALTAKLNALTVGLQEKASALAAAVPANAPPA